MKCGRPILAPIVLLLALLSAGAASAANTPNSFTLTPFVGWHFFEGNQQVNNRPGYGIAAGYNLTENWSVEARHGVTSRVLGKNPPYSSNTVHQFGLDVSYNFRTDHQVVPYLSAGGGVVFVEPSGRDIDKDFMLNYGGGIKFFLTDNIALRTDVRHIADINFNDSNDDGYYNNFAYTCGLTFQFDGASRKPFFAEPDGDAPVGAVIASSALAEPAPAPAPVQAAPPAPAPAPVPAPPAPVAVPVPAPVAVAAPAPAPYVAPSKDAAVVTAIKVVADGVQIDVKGKVASYKVFTLDKPSRLVIDLFDTVSTKARPEVPVNRHGIRAVRTAQHDDRHRIVFDAAGTELPYYRVIRSADGLRVELNP